MKETQLVSSLGERVRNLDCRFLTHKEYSTFFFFIKNRKKTFLPIYSFNQTFFNKWKVCSILSVNHERLNLFLKNLYFHPIDVEM